MSVRLAPAGEHRLIAGRFAQIADAASAGDWEAPSPVPGWTARDVVGHLIDWLPGFLNRALPPVDLTDPAAPPAPPGPESHFLGIRGALLCPQSDFLGMPPANLT
jgi:hypothetical protein